MFEHIYKTSTQGELKKIAREEGISPSGTKQELCHKLTEHFGGGLLKDLKKGVADISEIRKQRKKRTDEENEKHEQILNKLKRDYETNVKQEKERHQNAIKQIQSK